MNPVFSRCLIGFLWLVKLLGTFLVTFDQSMFVLGFTRDIVLPWVVSFRVETNSWVKRYFSCTPRMDVDKPLGFKSETIRLTVKSFLTDFFYSKHKGRFIYVHALIETSLHQGWPFSRLFYDVDSGAVYYVLTSYDQNFRLRDLRRHTGVP